MAVPDIEIKLFLSDAEFKCLVDIIDTIEALTGVDEDFTVEQRINVKVLDKALKRNGYKRKHGKA